MNPQRKLSLTRLVPWGKRTPRHTPHSWSPPEPVWAIQCTTAPSLPVHLSFLPSSEDVAWTHCWASDCGGDHSRYPPLSIDLTLTACQRSPTHHRFHAHTSCACSAVPHIYVHADKGQVMGKAGLVLVLVFAKQTVYTMPLLWKAVRDRKA